MHYGCRAVATERSADGRANPPLKNYLLFTAIMECRWLSNSVTKPVFSNCSIHHLFGLIVRVALSANKSSPIDLAHSMSSVVLSIMHTIFAFLNFDNVVGISFSCRHANDPLQKTISAFIGLHAVIDFIWIRPDFINSFTFGVGYVTIVPFNFIFIMAGWDGYL